MLKKVNPKTGIAEYLVRGRLREISSEKPEKNSWFEIKAPLGEEGIEPRHFKIKNREYNYYQHPLINNTDVQVKFLSEESVKGLFSKPEYNEPYEVIKSSIGKTLYRQNALIEKKAERYNKLEKAAIEEGLRD